MVCSSLAGSVSAAGEPRRHAAVADRRSSHAVV